MSGQQSPIPPGHGEPRISQQVAAPVMSAARLHSWPTVQQGLCWLHAECSPWAQFRHLPLSAELPLLSVINPTAKSPPGESCLTPMQVAPAQALHCVLDVHVPSKRPPFP